MPNIYTELDWLRIGISNYFGHDKETFTTRLIWFFTNERCLEELADQADKYYLYVRAVAEYRRIKEGHTSNVLIDLDACASGCQMMAILINCRTTAINTNVISNGKRNDIYMLVVEEMNKILPMHKQVGITFTRKQVKQAVMTAMYGSIANPRDLFGEDSDELKAFYKALEIVAPGAVELMEIIQSCWDPKALEHSWTMPDGFEVVVPVMDTVAKRIEVEGVGSFTYKANVPKASRHGVSLLANVCQSLESYVCREMIRMAHTQGFNILTIFDAFFCSPKHVDKMRSNYRLILSEIARKNTMQDILRGITNSQCTFTGNGDIHKEILRSVYALS